MNTLLLLSSAALLVMASNSPAQAVVLFDFDSAPVYSPLPIDVVAGGVTAHLTATGSGYSIQSTSTVPVVPVGFSGHFLYPSSVFAADLIATFSQPLTAFSILYAPQELGCDDSATMRVTAYRNGVFVGTNTTTAPNPGTWPAATLACAFPQGFDRVVVHYDAHPPTCQDYGPIFLADNLSVTLAPTGSLAAFGSGCLGSGGVPSLLPLTMPTIGQDCVVGVQNAPNNLLLGIGVLGFSNTLWNGAPLPTPMTFLGMPGCWLYVEPDSLWTFAPQGSQTHWVLSLPASQPLVGLQFFLQTLLLDPQVPDPANTLQAVVSDALAGSIGL